MRYTFTVSRTTGLLLLGGLALCLVLTFLAGWIVGANTQLTDRAAADTTAAPPATDTTTWATQDTLGASASRAAETENGSRADEPTSDKPAPRDSAATAPGRAAESPTIAGPDSTAERTSFTIQIGVFSSEDNAQQLADRVRSEGETVRVRTTQGQGRTLHYVELGRYENRAAAQRDLEAANAYTGNAYVMRRVQ